MSRHDPAQILVRGRITHLDPALIPVGQNGSHGRIAYRPLWVVRELGFCDLDAAGVQPAAHYRPPKARVCGRQYDPRATPGLPNGLQFCTDWTAQRGIDLLEK